MDSVNREDTFGVHQVLDGFPPGERRITDHSDWSTKSLLSANAVSPFQMFLKFLDVSPENQGFALLAFALHTLINGNAIATDAKHARPTSSALLGGERVRVQFGNPIFDDIQISIQFKTNTRLNKTIIITLPLNSILQIENFQQVSGNLKRQLCVMPVHLPKATRANMATKPQADSWLSKKIQHCAGESHTLHTNHTRLSKVG